MFHVGVGSSSGSRVLGVALAGYMHYCEHPNPETKVSMMPSAQHKKFRHSKVTIREEGKNDEEYI